MIVMEFLARLIATGCYAGYFPLAPGTFGSLIAIPLLYIIPSKYSWFFLISLILAGIWAAGVEEKQTGIKDNPKIVIDEFVGLILSLTGFSLSWPVVFTGFVFFRLLDIFKPCIIGKVQKLPGGKGIMADDILAGLLTNIIIRVLIIIF